MTVKWLPSYAPVDEEFGNVSLLLHGDGTIIDSSSNVQSVTVVGDAQISTAQSKFGGSSIAFDGSGDNLTVPDNGSFTMGTADFTVECWVRLANTSHIGAFITTAEPTDFQGFFLGHVNGTLYFLADGDGPFTWDVSLVGGSIAANSWTHIAGVRFGNTFTSYVNGVQVATTTSSISLANSNNILHVGGRSIENQYFNGYIEDLRITKGVARYTQNFTPPTAPFPDLSPSGRITIEDNSLDVDARQYIINVEEQDGQSLEIGVRTAINDFVVGCKSDGIWDAIKASCILAGARTLDGALVPLVGGAPTKNGTEGGWNYNRETGLQGNGTDNYLDSNRANNADPPDSAHVSVRVSSQGSGAFIVSGDSVSQGRNAIDDTGFTARFSCRSFATYSQPGTRIFANTLAAVSRSTDSSFVVRTNNSTITQNTSSNTPDSFNTLIFARRNSGVIDNFGNPRLAFYSIGESLDLAALDTRVSNLITAIGAAIP